MPPVTVFGRDGLTCKITNASIPYERKAGGFSGNGNHQNEKTLARVGSLPLPGSKRQDTYFFLIDR
jgi:hypothetical protein